MQSINPKPEMRSLDGVVARLIDDFSSLSQAGNARVVVYGPFARQVIGIARSIYDHNYRKPTERFAVHYYLECDRENVRAPTIYVDEAYVVDAEAQLNNRVAA